MFSARKKKTIHLIRHCQSTFNVPPHDANKLDPDLTVTGVSQARTLGRSFPYLTTDSLIVASPLRRALNTALHAFGHHLSAANSQILALPELQELSQWPCDTGSSLPSLLTEFRDHPVDFEKVTFDWDSKDGYFSPSERRTLERMKNTRQWLYEQEAQNIVCIGHGHCLQLLVGEGSYEQIRAGLCSPEWQNGEWRSYHIEVGPNWEKQLVETKESLKRRGKHKNVALLEGDGNSIARPVTAPAAAETIPPFKEKSPKSQRRKGNPQSPWMSTNDPLSQKCDDGGYEAST
ncbi:putative phosphatase SPAC5H10.03 [Venturia nashicola]|nr:putative phosphatase SPAC5H10.03 [Venturia nashicola]